MKILYDHQIFTFQKSGGISRYFCELYSHLLTMDTIHPEISLVYSENSHYQELFHQKNLFPDVKTLGKYLNFGKKKIVNTVNKFNSENQISHGNFDILHPTYYDPYFLKYIKTKPYVLTVYDMIHELFPGFFTGDNTARRKKRVIECATKIIAISENTKDDIIEFYDIDPQIIEVIHLGTLLHTAIPDRTLSLPQKYILYVGNRGGYKNFMFFINSVSSFLTEEKDLYLICAGGGAFNDDENHLFFNLNIKSKILHYPIVDDNFLSQLYRNATLFVFPSLYEGFGIPLLEAFSCGCPIASSNCSSFPEVGGEAVNYFDPYDSESILKVVEDIVHCSSLQD